MAASHASRKDVFSKFAAFEQELERIQPHSQHGVFAEWQLPVTAGGPESGVDLVVVRRGPKGLTCYQVKAGGSRRQAAQGAMWEEMIEVFTSFLERTPLESASLSSSRAALPAPEVEALRQGGIDFDRAPSGENALTAGVLEFMRLVHDSYTTAQAARVLRVKDSRIRQRVGADRPTLFAFRHGRSWRIPRFQFQGRSAVPGIETVVGHLDRTLHPLSVVRWFVQPNPDLVLSDEEPVAPIDWLKAGGSPDAAAELAASL